MDLNALADRLERVQAGFALLEGGDEDAGLRTLLDAVDVARDAFQELRELASTDPATRRVRAYLLSVETRTAAALDSWVSNYTLAFLGEERSNEEAEASGAAAGEELKQAIVAIALVAQVVRAAAEPGDSGPRH